MSRPHRKFRRIALLAIAVGLNYGGGLAPAWVERLYARGLFPLLGQTLSRVTRVVPFSIAEAVVVLTLVALPGLIIHWFATSRRRPSNWLRGPWRLLSLAALIYAMFVLLWGLNYQRLPLAAIASLPVQPSTVAELTDLCQDLLIRTNELRQTLTEDANGVMSLPGGKWRALTRADLGYQQAARSLPAIGGTYGSPKGVYLSGPWSYTGISGMYFPFTGEANVNMAGPDPFIPAVACHEMAHQRGFAREDEANYLAYLTCVNHPDPEFQYSGLLSALTNAARALRSQDEAAYAALRQDFAPGLGRDLAANQEFWERYSGPIERLSNSVNDNYLKSQGQVDGVQSYGRMVDLLLAEQRQRAR